MRLVVAAELLVAVSQVLVCGTPIRPQGERPFKRFGSRHIPSLTKMKRRQVIETGSIVRNSLGERLQRRRRFIERTMFEKELAKRISQFKVIGGISNGGFNDSPGFRHIADGFFYAGLQLPSKRRRLSSDVVTQHE